MKVQTTWSGSRRGSIARRRMERAARGVALIVIAACSGDPQLATTPSIPDPRFGFGGHGGGVVGAGNAHKVVVCVNPITSTPWTYHFTTTVNPNSDPLELPSPAPADPDYAWPHTTGPYNPGDVITASVSLTATSIDFCVTVFQRDATPTHANNRLWVLSGGIWNPDATVDVSLDVPPGFTYTVLCSQDDPGFVENCSASGPVTASANIYDGSQITYSIHGSPSAMVGALRVIVSDIGLPKGAAKDLNAKLLKAQNALDEGRTAAACKELAHVITYVTGHTGKVIGAGDAANVIEKVGLIQAELGC